MQERDQKLADLEADYNKVMGLLLDEMPAADEAQDFFLTHELNEVIDELKRWRKSHNHGEFNPDWCAANDALKEALQLNKRQSMRIGGLMGVLCECSVQVDEDTREQIEHAISDNLPDCMTMRRILDRIEIVPNHIVDNNEKVTVIDAPKTKLQQAIEYMAVKENT